MGKSKKGKGKSYYNRKQVHGPGVKWPNMRDAIYTTEGINVPRDLSKLYSYACKKGGVVKAQLYVKLMFEVIEEQLGKETADEMREFMKLRFPICKDKETKEYWLKRLGLFDTDEDEQ